MTALLLAAQIEGLTVPALPALSRSWWREPRTLISFGFSFRLTRRGRLYRFYTCLCWWGAKWPRYPSARWVRPVGPGWARGFQLARRPWHAHVSIAYAEVYRER